MIHSKKTSKGNVIVFALSAIAVMSLSAAALATTTLLALRKGSNVEKAIFAKYNAESGVEQMLYIINESLRKGKDLDAIALLIENMFGLGPGTFDFNGSDTLDCAAPIPPLVLKCKDLNIALGVNDLPLNLSQNEVFTLNMFDIANRNKPPYETQIDTVVDPKAGYVVDKITIHWSGGATHEFEFSFFVWDKVKLDAGVVGSLLPPVKRRVKGQDVISFSFKNGSPNIAPAGADNICIPALTGIEQSICSIGPSTPTGGEILLGTILIKLISQGSLNGATLRLWEEDNDGLGADVDTQRQIPGFIEVRASGQEESNKKAVRIIQNISANDATPGKQFISEIWDYAIFSDKSLSK